MADNKPGPKEGSHEQPSQDQEKRQGGATERSGHAPPNQTGTRVDPPKEDQKR